MIVLDTHILIWWVNNGGQLSQAAKKAITKESKSEDGEILVSTITTWEIAMLIKKGRLSLSMDITDWIANTADIEKLRYVPLDNDVAMHSVELPGDFHPDPADRIITALARKQNVSLVTADKKIRDYKFVKTIW